MSVCILCGVCVNTSFSTVDTTTTEVSNLSIVNITLTKCIISTISTVITCVDVALFYLSLFTSHSH